MDKLDWNQLKAFLETAETGSLSAAAHLLPSLLRQLRDQEPGISVEVISSNALSDLQRREADIAIRAAPPVLFPIWLVSHRELRTLRRIRVVFEALAQGLVGGN